MTLPAMLGAHTKSLQDENAARIQSKWRSCLARSDYSQIAMTVVPVVPAYHVCVAGGGAKQDHFFTPVTRATKFADAPTAPQPKSHSSKRRVFLRVVVTGTLAAIFTTALTLLVRNPFAAPRPTLLSGGGRDWSVDLARRIITATHAPHLALGSFAHDPLILAERRAATSTLLRLSPEALASLQRGESVPLRALDLALQFPGEAVPYEEWDVALAGAADLDRDVNATAAADAPRVSFADANFLMLDGEYALDVSYWKMTAGNTVHFVRAAPERRPQAQTKVRGGGRDWALNADDGTISPRGHPELALGRGARALVLVDAERHGGRAWRFPAEELRGLVDGVGAMELQSEALEAAVTKRYEEVREFDGWRYIESRVVSSTDNEDGIQVKFVEGNYLALEEEGREDEEEEALVLDVSFWDMEEFNTVNFVGGSSYRE